MHADMNKFENSFIHKSTNKQHHNTEAYSNPLLQPPLLQPPATKDWENTAQSTKRQLKRQELDVCLQKLFAVNVPLDVGCHGIIISIK